MNFKGNKKIYFLLILLGLLLISFLIYNFSGSADVANNKIAMKTVKLIGIDTGSGTFDSNDNPGNDSSASNRSVRSFDTLTYHFSFSIVGKDSNNYYENRKVKINVSLPEDISKYISFEPDGIGGSDSSTYVYEGIYTEGIFEKDITLYVLGAPNGTKINPKFEIQEETNTDSNYVVTLGNIQDDTYYYEYDKDASNNYKTTSGVQGFTNYMPTTVSSKTANLQFKLYPLNNENSETQKATYNDKIGRYLTYALGIELVGDNTKGVKGYTMPEGDIKFNISSTQNGAVTTGVINPEWVRLYGNESHENIEPVLYSLPFSSTTTESSKRIASPGNISLDSNIITISDYNTVYSSVKANANGTSLSNSENMIGTYAITVFSERNNSDNKNDVTNTLSISNVSAKDTQGTNLSISNVSSSIVNKYYENKDYSLVGEFVDDSGKKYSTDNGEGAVSKGETTRFKTTFKYNKTLSNQGLKEIIKVDSDAFRVMPVSDKDIRISISGSDKITENDFEISYISGSYDASNYSINTLSSRVEDSSSVSCPSSIGTFNKDQIMNLYGGPCIKANSGVEQKFDKISAAKDSENKEIPITKIVIQTKKGVVLPDSVTVTIEVGLRVRNVGDLTRTYQMTAVASSSDYDDVLTYYAPRITDNENSITNENNYRKTVYNGNQITNIDNDSSWGDSLKIVNFTSRQEISVTNKNSDGTMKLNYNANNGTTITYNIKTIINDDNMEVGADDVWYINNLKVVVTLPKELIYVPDNKLGTPTVTKNNDQTVLTYTLPYTKPNMKISDINFKATINPNIKGSSVPITVKSVAEAININGERDTSLFKLIQGSLTVYASGIDNVIVSQKVGDQGSVVDKNSKFTYILEAYNNTTSNINNYTLLDILPSSNDKNGSKFDGSYKVKIELPSSLANAKVYCSTSNKLTNEVLDTNNEFNECNITSEFTEVTGIKITNISINSGSYIDPIKVIVEPKNNNYDNKYINSFVGGSQTYSQNESNKIEVRVISRNISGNVFRDVNENGIKDTNEKGIKNIPVTLYKLDSDNNINKVEDIITDENGNYKFRNLDTGRYKIRANYDKEVYDLTLRYATEDITVDSDAYKMEEGTLEISNTKKEIMDKVSSGIRVVNDVESIPNMDIGLISKKSLHFDIDKFITRVDLTYNNVLETKNYPNQKIVKQDVRKSVNAYAKVYYGIKIDNNSNLPGTIKLVEESIPEGAIFDENDPLNKGWVYYNGVLKNISLENQILNPGETRYLTIVLNIPPQNQYNTYLNKVTLDVEQYNPETLAEEAEATINDYAIGDKLTYAGVDWNVINIENSGDEQLLTLLSRETNIKASHTVNSTDIYKWSTSKINETINSSVYINSNSLNTPILKDNLICDDASGLPTASYGGTLKSEGKCQTGIYNSYKIRLLNENDIEILRSKATTLDFLKVGNNENIWLMNSVYQEQTHDSYGRITNSVSNKAKYFSTSDFEVKIQNANVSTNMEVRPVITISNKNIIPE